MYKPVIKMPKRTSSGLVKYRTKSRSKIPRKKYSSRRQRRVKRGIMTSYRFHRWITGFATGNNGTGNTYDSGTSVITCTAANSTAAFTQWFQFDHIPNYTEFVNLFDSYMITGVMLQIKMIDSPDSINQVNTAPTANFNSNNFYPTIWYVADHDDTNSPTLAAIKEFEKVRHKVLRPNQELNIMLRPTVLQQVYRTSLTTGYSTAGKRQWLDLANVDIPHFGFKSVIDFEGVSPASTFKFKVNAKYFFSCKSVR